MTEEANSILLKLPAPTIIQFKLPVPLNPIQDGPSPHGIRYNPLAPANFSLETRALNPNETLLHFVRLLRQRYQAVLAHTASDAPRTPFLLQQTPSLALAEAYLRLASLPARAAEPLHIAVIGPTQAGKSSVVNCLCRQTAAQVSPLAGYTVHPQGFVLGDNKDQLEWLNDYYSGFQRLAPDKLPHGRYDCFSVTELASQANHPLAPAVIWDTPDFDSIDAEGYREGVLRAAALADVLLVVVSKDKYADQSVWDVLQLLAPLEQPTVLCLNKTADDSRDIVETSLRRRWKEQRGGHSPAIISLPYRQDWGPTAWQEDNGIATELLNQLAQAASKLKKAQYAQPVRRLLTTHWDIWLEPVRGEQNALNFWNQQVTEAVADAVKLYQRDYLNHPQHYDTFQRALVELLTMLEIPGLAKPLHMARQAITWPLRQITKLSRRVVNKPAQTGGETLILSRIVEHMLLHLAESVLQQREQGSRLYGWWNELGRLLQNQRVNQQQVFDIAIQRYQQDFLPEIEGAAERLLARLQEHPTMLNSLRAARFTTDAAGLALAVHAGGIGLHSFILAPAVLSITSFLTESALGRYLHKIEADLKQRQRDTVSDLLHAQAEQTLLHLPEQLNVSDKFNVPAQTIATAEKALHHEH